MRLPVRDAVFFLSIVHNNKLLKQIALPSQAGLFYTNTFYKFKNKKNETNEKIVNMCKKRCKTFYAKIIIIFELQNISTRI